MSGTQTLAQFGPEFAFLPAIDGDEDTDPRKIADRLVNNVQRFSHLNLGEAVILFLMRRDTKVSKGRTELGSIALPAFQGGLGGFAKWLLIKFCGDALPDYVMFLDAAWWERASGKQREALVFHELCHTVHEKDKEGELKFTDEGRPVFGIQGHDIEEFSDVVRRYGAWKPDLHDFIDALREGGAV
jgi:hypothetical protein